jgi:hypothetical protein
VKRAIAYLLTFVVALTLWAQARATNQLSSEEVQRQWISRLDGRHFSATIVLTVDRQGKREERWLTVWRDDLGPHRERMQV